ncbi:hypothetical protein Avbf_07087, partial [Armadillidium vulgare]
MDIKVEMKSMNEILENVKEEETFDETFEPKILVGECEKSSNSKNEIFLLENIKEEEEEEEHKHEQFQHESNEEKMFRCSVAEKGSFQESVEAQTRIVTTSPCAGIEEQRSDFVSATHDGSLVLSDKQNEDLSQADLNLGSEELYEPLEATCLAESGEVVLSKEEDEEAEILKRKHRVQT